MIPAKINVKEDIGDQEEAIKFSKLMPKINIENPHENDIKAAKDILENNPNLYKRVPGIWAIILDNVVDKYYQGNSNKLLVKAEMRGIKNELGYQSSSGLERLVIDEIVLARFYLLTVENAVFQMKKFDMETNNIWDNKLDKAQKRYLKAVGTLAKVRKISNSFNFQLNIAADGGKQVNVNNGGEGI